MFIDAAVKAQIAKHLREKIQSSGLPDTEFQKKFNIKSPVYFNQIKNGKYTDDYPKNDYWHALARVIGFEGTEKYWRHFDTTHYTNTQQVALRARDEKEAWILDGGTGYGKSHALDQLYKGSAKDSNIFYFRFYNESLKPVEFLRKLLKLMGVTQIKEVSVDDCSLTKCNKHLIDRLINRPNALLIIDEMEYCSTACFKELRKLIYETVKKCGILLCGCGLKGTIEKLATSKNAEKSGWKQLHSRLKYNVAVLEKIGANAQDEIQTDRWYKIVRGICKEMGIEDRQTITYICKNACDFRDLRALVSKGLEAADITKQPLTLDLLYSTINNVLPS